MTAASWRVCMHRAAGRMPTHDARRTTHASMAVWRRARRICVRCLYGVGVLVFLAGLVVMPLLAVLDLGLQRFGRDAGRVVEHQPATEHPGPHQSQDAHD